MEGEMLGLLSLAIVAAVALVGCSEAPDNGGRNYSPPASARLSGSEMPNRSDAWHPCEKQESVLTVIHITVECHELI